MSPDIKAHLREFYNRLQDRPLEPDDPFYVPFVQQAVGQSDPIQDLSTKITWSPSQSVHLLTGHRGSGKSTELRRLRKLLQNEGCVVFLCDMSKFINMTTPIEITDFLISIMGAMSEEFERQFGASPAEESYWERLLNFLKTEVSIKEIKMEAGVTDAKLGLTASLKDDPSFKRTLQTNLRGHVARLVQQSREFGASVVERIRAATKDQDKKVVLIVDSVEQIRGVGADADQVYRSVENLFSGHAESLQFPLLHIVYTIPPWLTPLAPGLGARLGGGMLCNLPSVHVFKRNVGPEAIPDTIGLGTMHEIMSKRCSHWEDVFTKGQIDAMALDTGGDLRDFFRFIRESLVKATTGGSLPVNDAIIDEVRNHLHRDMLPIADEDMEWLKKIHQSKGPALESIAGLQRLARFFDTSLVLNYRNSDDWYDIHPLLKDLMR